MKYNSVNIYNIQSDYINVEAKWVQHQLHKVDECQKLVKLLTKVWLLFYPNTYSDFRCYMLDIWCFSTYNWDQLHISWCLPGLRSHQRQLHLLVDYIYTSKGYHKKLSHIWHVLPVIHLELFYSKTGQQ